jgi:hypothetical protein
MKKLQLVVVAAFAALYLVFFGDGAVTVAAPRDRPLKVHVDGEEVASLAPGEHRRIGVEPGSHELRLESAGKVEAHRLDVTNGTYDRVIPLSDQCFALSPTCCSRRTSWSARSRRT